MKNHNAINKKKVLQHWIAIRSWPEAYFLMT